MESGKTMRLDDDLIASFKEFGAVLLPKVISEGWVKKFEDDLDDYNAIMTKALADRLAEAFAEYMHEQVRKEFWGYDQTEQRNNEELIKEKYIGIRPAPGYPACPEHTVKEDIFSLLEANEIGMQLTESMAMHPASSVSGFYFAHPDAKYFSVDKIDKDQLEDMASRRSISIKQLQK